MPLYSYYTVFLYIYRKRSSPWVQAAPTLSFDVLSNWDKIWSTPYSSTPLLGLFLQLWNRWLLYCRKSTIDCSVICWVFRDRVRIYSQTHWVPVRKWGLDRSFHRLIGYNWGRNLWRCHGPKLASLFHQYSSPKALLCPPCKQDAWWSHHIRI